MQIANHGPISKIFDAIVDRINSAAQRLADRIRAQQTDMRDRFTPEQAELLPIEANEIQLPVEDPTPAARQITTRRLRLHVVPDRDHLADLEAANFVWRRSTGNSKFALCQSLPQCRLKFLVGPNQLRPDAA
jgi:hypothetical protein